MKQVVRVVPPLHLGQTPMVRSVRGAPSVAVVVREELGYVERILGANGRTSKERASALGERRDELRAARHALDLLAPEEVVELLDARVRGVAGDLLDPEVRVRDRGDLR